MATPYVLTARVQTVIDRASLRRANDIIRRNFSSRPLRLDVKVNDKHLRDLNKRLQEVGGATKKAQAGMAGFANSVKLATTRFVAFGIGAGIVVRLAMAFREGFAEAVKFDRELIRLTQVTGKSRAGLQPLVAQITELSTSLGVSSLKMVEMTRILAQTGLSASDTRIAMAALAKTELAPTFTNIEKTAEGAIAAMRQFNIAAKDLEATLGAINAVSKQFAVESDDIITAVRRTGGVFQAAGGSVNELIALFTSVRATTRETAETIATGLRTIFTRIQRPKTIKFLRQFGIELTDLQGNFVGPMEAIRRLSTALQGMESTDMTFGRIIEQLGGFRQVGKVIPMITKHETAIKALGVAEAGANSLTLDSIKAQKSLEVQFSKVKEEFMAMMREMVSSEGFKAMISMVLKLASSLIKLVEALAPLLPMLGALGAVKLGGMMGGMAMTKMGGMGGMMAGGGGMAAAGAGALLMASLAGPIAELAGATEDQKAMIEEFGMTLAVASVAVMMFGKQLGGAFSAATMVTAAFYAYYKAVAEAAKREKERAIKAGAAGAAGLAAERQARAEQAGLWATVAGVIAIAIAAIIAFAIGLAMWPALLLGVLVAITAAGVAAMAGWTWGADAGAAAARQEAEARAEAVLELEKNKTAMEKYEKTLKRGPAAFGRASNILTDASEAMAARIADAESKGIDPASEEYGSMQQALADMGARAAKQLSRVAVEGAKAGMSTQQIINANQKLIDAHVRGASASTRLAAAELRAAAIKEGDMAGQQRANEMLVEAHMQEYDARIEAAEQVKRDREQTIRHQNALQANARMFALHTRLVMDLGNVTDALTIATIEAADAMKGISAAAALGTGKVGSTKVGGKRGKLHSGGIGNVAAMPAFTAVVDQIMGPLGNLGTDVRDHVVNSAAAFEQVPEQILQNIDPATGMINQGYLEDGGGLDTFLGGLAGVPQSVKETISTSMKQLQTDSDITPEKIMKKLEEAGALLDPVMKKLQEVYKAQLQHLNKLNKAYDQQRKVAGAVAKAQKDIVSHSAKAIATMKKHLGMERTIADGRMAFHMEQQALLGQGGMGALSGNVAGMGVALRNTNAQIIQAEKDMESVVGDPVAAKAAADNLATLKNQSESLTNALKHATNMADQRGIVEEKIAKAKEERESRKGLLEEYTFGSGKERRGLGKDLKVTQFAAAVGDMDKIPGKLRGTVLKTLDRFKDTIIPGSGGRTGEEVKNQLMARQAQKMGASPQQIKSILMRGKEEQVLIQELGRLFAMENAARMELMKTQKDAGRMLTDQIKQMHIDFVTRLQNMLQQIQGGALNPNVGLPGGGGLGGQGGPGAGPGAQAPALPTAMQMPTGPGGAQEDYVVDPSSGRMIPRRSLDPRYVNETNRERAQRENARSARSRASAQQTTDANTARAAQTARDAEEARATQQVNQENPMQQAPPSWWENIIGGQSGTEGNTYAEQRGEWGQRLMPNISGATAQRADSAVQEGRANQRASGNRAERQAEIDRIRRRREGRQTPWWNFWSGSVREQQDPAQVPVAGPASTPSVRVDEQDPNFRPNFNEGGGNTDTVPAMLTPGEFVIKRSSAKKIGYGNLHAMNNYANGGPVSSFFKSPERSPSLTSADYMKSLEQPEWFDKRKKHRPGSAAWRKAKRMQRSENRARYQGYSSLAQKRQYLQSRRGGGRGRRIRNAFARRQMRGGRTARRLNRRAMRNMPHMFRRPLRGQVPNAPRQAGAQNLNAFGGTKFEQYAEGGAVQPVQYLNQGGPVDFSGAGGQLEEALGPVMAQFQGVNVSHNVNHENLNVTGGDGIGDAIAQAVMMKVGGLVEAMTSNLINQAEPDATGKLKVRPS